MYMEVVIADMVQGRHDYKSLLGLHNPVVCITLSYSNTGDPVNTGFTLSRVWKKKKSKSPASTAGAGANGDHDGAGATGAAAGGGAEGGVPMTHLTTVQASA